MFRGVSKFIDKGVEGVPLSVVKDGDLRATILAMLMCRRSDTIEVSKVKGHADQLMVAEGSDRQEDLLGNGLC